MKKALLIRYGGIGDMVCVTPVLPLVKADGYHITFNTTERGREVLKNNPFVDEWLMHDSSIPPDDRLTKHWEEISKGFDRVINFSESIEGTLAKVPWRNDFHDSQERRHLKCNKNFYDWTLEWAGYPNVKGKNGELYFSPMEEKLAKQYRDKHRDKFIILWSLSGSSPHKAYAYAEYVAIDFLRNHPEAMIITVGDDLCQLLEWTHPRTKNQSGQWSIRQSMIMAKYADLVIGTDTGVLHAAGCFDTPKVILHSSNTVENLSKYWKNCFNIVSGVKCQPCHRLHYTMEHCILDPRLATPLCMAMIDPKKVYSAIEYYFDKWRHEHGSLSGRDRGYDVHGARGWEGTFSQRGIVKPRPAAGEI